MIAKTIFFIKIKRLTHGMRAVYDQVVCVPIETADVENNISKFPRHPKDSEIVAVKLRRKLEYKTVVLQEYVRPQVRISFVYHVWFLGYVKNYTSPSGCDQCSEKIKGMRKSVLPRC